MSFVHVCIYMYTFVCVCVSIWVPDSFFFLGDHVHVQLSIALLFSLAVVVCSPSWRNSSLLPVTVFLRKQAT